MDIQRPRRMAFNLREMAEQRVLFQVLQRGDDIVHLQLAVVVEMNSQAQKEAPVQRGYLLPVVGNIGLDFPVFLIYLRQAIKDLAGEVGF